MSESVRRRTYRYDRVLIETDRVLSPQFDDAVVYLTGAQIEMLRNVSQYLNRLDTYVTEYNPGYYIAPTAADYDDILEIVADLEEVLMGNPNTIWGYKDTYRDADNDLVVGAGEKTLYYGTVPAGTVWRIQSITARNDTTACSKIVVWAGYPTGDVIVYEQPNPVANQLELWQGSLVLKYDCNFWVKFHGCQDGDYITTYARGYKMAVP